jgi:hypothetical protein
MLSLAPSELKSYRDELQSFDLPIVSYLGGISISAEHSGIVTLRRDHLHQQEADELC